MDEWHLQQPASPTDTDPLNPNSAKNDGERNAATATVSPQAAAERALALLLKPGSLGEPRLALGPRPTGELAAALAELGDPPPKITVRCNNYGRCGGRRLTRWIYDPQWQAIVPHHRETTAWTHGAPYWLDRANAGKGPVKTASGRGGKHDGNGTHNYHCRCGRNIPVKAQRRFRLYLEAIAKGRKEILI
jgi:hypothetical protein